MQKEDIKYPIRVLFLDTVMDRGGAEAMTMNYMRNIDRSKIQFDFLVHRQYKAKYEDEIESLGGKIYRICPIYPQNFSRYKKEIKRFFTEHPEYRIIHCNMMELGYFAYKAASECNIPVIICHSHSAYMGNKINPKYLFRLYFRSQIKKYITHKFACGKAAGEWLYGNDKDVIIMNNAIDAESFRYSKATDEEIRKEFNLKDKFVIGHVGRFFKPKNHTFLIDIFNEVYKRDRDAVLMLVGGGETDDKMMNFIKDKVKKLGLENNVIFTGVRNDVNRIMQCFDLFILPSLFEGLPVVAIEAQAAGLKCVLSDTITDECNITGNIEKLSLSDASEVWAEHILKYKNTYKKKDMYKKIVDANYDIKSNAKWLENFYINALRNE